MTRAIKISFNSLTLVVKIPQYPSNSEVVIDFSHVDQESWTTKYSPPGESPNNATSDNREDDVVSNRGVYHLDRARNEDFSSPGEASDPNHALPIDVTMRSRNSDISSLVVRSDSSKTKDASNL